MVVQPKIFQCVQHYIYNSHSNILLRCSKEIKALITARHGESIRIKLCKVDLTNMARICPVQLYMPTIPLPASDYRTTPPAYSQPSPTRDHQK